MGGPSQCRRAEFRRLNSRKPVCSNLIYTTEGLEIARKIGCRSRVALDGEWTGLKERIVEKIEWSRKAE